MREAKNCLDSPVILNCLEPKDEADSCELGQENTVQAEMKSLLTTVVIGLIDERFARLDSPKKSPKWGILVVGVSWRQLLVAEQPFNSDLPLDRSKSHLSRPYFCS